MAKFKVGDKVKYVGSNRSTNPVVVKALNARTATNAGDNSLTAGEISKITQMITSAFPGATVRRMDIDSSSVVLYIEKQPYRFQMMVSRAMTGDGMESYEYEVSASYMGYRKKWTRDGQQYGFDKALAYSRALVRGAADMLRKWGYKG